MVLMTGLNISSQTLNLAKHFSPALIRIHGPSTGRLSFSDHDTDPAQTIIPDFSTGGLMVTPTMWTALNEWIISANLTPVYALNDRDRVNDAWNPKATALPLMELTDKMNITCYWELAIDASNKTLKQYVDDLTSLRHILDAFPVSRNSWGIVGGDFNQCSAPENTDVTRKLLLDIETHLEAVNWSPKALSMSHYPEKITKLTPFTTKYSPAVWTTAPRSPKPTSFKDGLLWAKYLGQAATAGYDVIFRQPKIKELFEITPAYWVSLFHKTLMGRNVLHIRSFGYNSKEDCFIYAHCTKRQNRFSRRGAATILTVNMEKDEVNASVKLMGIHGGNLEIQSYVLTAPSEDSSEIYLNGHLLTISDLQDSQIEFMPKVRRAKTSASVMLTLPAQSIGFFVMPNARFSACINGEEEIHHIREEIFEDQNENMWNDETAEIERDSETMTSMNELYMMMEDLLASNEKYYKNPEILKKTREWKKLLLDRAKEARKETSTTEIIPIEEKHITTIPGDVRKMIIGRAKLVESQKKLWEIEKRKLGLRQLLLDRTTRLDKFKPKEDVVVPTDLELSSDEINRILTDREKTKIEEKDTKDDASKKVDELKTLKAGDLLKHLSAFKIPRNTVSRKRRQLQNIEMNDVRVRKAANDEQLENCPNVNDIENDEVSDIIEPENQCQCRKTGKCTCGLRLASNLINKIWGMPKELLKGNFNNIENVNDVYNLLNDQRHTENPLEYTQILDNKEKRDRDIEEIMKLLKQYHNEVKSIATSIKDIEQMNIEKNEKHNQISTFEMQRSKRSLVETLKEKHRQGRQKLRNKIKSRKIMYENKIKEKNALPKHGQRFRRIKRRTKEEKETNTNEIGDNTIDNSIIVQPTTECQTTIIDSTETESATKTDSSTKDPIVGKPAQSKQNLSRVRALNRKLVQQKRLEERISAYLSKIIQSNNHLTQEIQRSARSINEDDSEMLIDNRENMIDGAQNHVTGIHISADPQLVNPLQNTIRKYDTNNLLFDILKRNQDNLLDIRKREIPYDISDEIRNKMDYHSKMVDDNKTTKWNVNDEDKTKEEEIYFNEIPKDDNMMIKSSMDNIYEEYNSDPEILFNEISKVDKFLPAKLRKEEFIYVTDPKILNTQNYASEDKFKEEVNKSEDEYGTKSELAESTEIFNVKIPVKQGTDNNIYEVVPPYPIFDTVSPLQETTINGDDFNAKDNSLNQIENINFLIPVQNGDRRESVLVLDNKVWKTENKVHKDGFVDNVFETVFNFLNNFHSKIAGYLKYLAR
ncbi:uncharacterized protein CBL_00529 [Carabus blaptoides fortunei]